MTTSFVESCQKTVTGSAVAAERKARGRPRALKLLKTLEGKKSILITTHQHPDPDAMASALGMCVLLTKTLAGAHVEVAFKGRVGAGGINASFVKHADLQPAPWDDAAIAGGKYDAVILVDVQPAFALSPLPATVTPIAVIDHHLSHGRRLKCPFCDLRTDVGATASIVFSYFMELNVPIPPDLAAVLLFAIETDLAGAAGTPGDLDNVALSSLTLMADARKLYQMRYVDLPQTFYIAFAKGLEAAVAYDTAVVAHLDSIDSVEKAAILADLFLRYESAKWSMVTAVYETKLVVSIRRREGKLTAAQVARKVLRGIGEGGGHRNKAGGAIVLQTNTPAELDRYRKQLRRRFLRLLGIEIGRGQKLVPEVKKLDHTDGTAAKAKPRGKKAPAPVASPVPESVLNAKL